MGSPPLPREPMCADAHVVPLCFLIVPRRQAVLGFDVEAIRLGPGSFGISPSFESNHRPLQNSALEPKSYVVKVLAGMKPEKLAEQSQHRYRLRPTPAADQIGDVVAKKSFVIVYVATHDDDPGLQRVPVFGQVALDFGLVLGPWKNQVPNWRIMQDDQDELDFRTGMGDLLFEPAALLSSRFEG